MSEHSRAEEDLRVIRTLMERATIYRAISAPTALVGAILAMLSAAFVTQALTLLGRTIRPREFAFIWIDVLVLTLIANALLVWREAKNNGRPFISSGMRLALRAVAPVLVVPALFTAWFFNVGHLGGVELELVVVWVVFYGLALLSTAMFAPRSLVLLGWAFLLTGASVPIFAGAIDRISDDVPNFVMGSTFGLYHLIYALCTWPWKRSRSLDPIADE